MKTCIDGNSIYFEGFIKGKISVDPFFGYVGGVSFILYEVANCEIHLFADVDEWGRVLRLFRFQFEGYLSDNDYRYNYSGDPFRTVIDDVEFFGRGSIFKEASVLANLSDRSDGMRVRRVLKQKDQLLEGDYMSVRYVCLDKERRQELMFFYVENLSQHGLSILDFEGSKGEYVWQNVLTGLRARSLRYLKIRIE
jgi:hypothetical protein